MATTMTEPSTANEGSGISPAPENLPPVGARYVVARDVLRRNGREFSDFQRADQNIENMAATVDLYPKTKGWQKAETLGLHFSNGGTIRPSHFVGAVWLERPEQSSAAQNGIPLVVRPKIKDIDAVQMFTEVMAHGTLEGMDGLCGFKPEQPLIDCDEPINDLSLFQVAVYLSELARFCQRQLRIDFLPFTDNLQGRIKGRVLIRENLRRNIIHARPDRVVCRFETMTLDTPANRILKWALLLATRFMAQYGANIPEALWDWARSASAALSPVSEVPVGSRDFLGIHYGGLMQRYRTIHALARMIIRRLRSDAEGAIEEIKGQTVPFWLNMNALFEGYVGVLLQRAGRADFSAQKSRSFGNAQSLLLQTRPDYITDDGSIVVDAKYKGLFEDVGADEEAKAGEKVQLAAWPGLRYQPSNQDLYQIIAYSTLFAGDLSASRRAFLAVPVPATQSAGKQLLRSWHPALDKSGFAQDPLVPPLPFLKASIPAGLELLVGILPAPVPVKETAT